MDRRVIRTKHAIQDAYFQLIMDKKTTKITVTDIAKHANIDRKTFYLHYQTPLDIIDDYCLMKVNEMFQELQNNGFFDEPFHTKNVFNALNHLIDQNISFYQQMTYSQFDHFWDCMKKNIVQSAIPAYRIKVSVSDEELDITIDYIISAILSIYKRWLKNDIHLSLEEMSTIVNEVTFNGIQNLANH